jgi:hypothetical protein
MFKLISILLFGLQLTVASLVSYSQSIPEDNTVAMIRANYLYQFANNNNWPVETKHGKFFVGILGNTDVFELMSSKYGTKPIGSQTLDVLALTDLPQSAFLHILFIDKSRKAELPKFVKELKDKSTLIVTNWDGAIAQGAHINFKNIDGSIRFELNKEAMEGKKITPGIKILQWAVQ